MLTGNLKTSALSPHAMERMTIQMSKCSCDNTTCRPCIPTSHDMYLEFLDRIIAIGSINNYKTNGNNNDNEDIEEESSSVGKCCNVSFSITKFMSSFFFKLHNMCYFDLNLYYSQHNL